MVWGETPREPAGPVPPGPSTLSRLLRAVRAALRRALARGGAGRDGHPSGPDGGHWWGA